MRAGSFVQHGWGCGLCFCAGCSRTCCERGAQPVAPRAGLVSSPRPQPTLPGGAGGQDGVCLTLSPSRPLHSWCPGEGSCDRKPGNMGRISQASLDVALFPGLLQSPRDNVPGVGLEQRGHSFSPDVLVQRLVPSKQRPGHR